MSERPRNKNLVPLTERSAEEARAIRSAGGKASQAKRKERTQQAYLLGKYAGAPILHKNTIAKYKKMGFDDEEITRALQITDAIMKGAIKGDPRMIEIYLRLTGEDRPMETTRENNLLDAIDSSTRGDLNTDDIPELQQKAEPDPDVVESSEV